MQQFFVDYGLYLLIALLIGIAVIFLATRGKGGVVEDAPTAPAPDTGPIARAEALDAPGASDAPLASDPVPVIAVPPLPLVEPLVEPRMEPPVTPIDDVAPEPARAHQPSPPEEAAPQPVTADGDDDLSRLKGVGPKLKVQLTQLGVTRFAQIAAWSDSDLAAVDAQLGAFKGRPVRDHWIDQAKYLAAGDIAGFEAKYGKI